MSHCSPSQIILIGSSLSVAQPPNELIDMLAFIEVNGRVLKELTQYASGETERLSESLRIIKT